MAPPTLASLRTSARVTPVSRLPTIVSPASDQFARPSNGDHSHQPDQGPLFLSIDSGSRKMRGLVIDALGLIAWMGEVEFDQLGFSTRGGVLDDDGQLVCPSLVKVAALDKLLGLLAAFGEYHDSSVYPTPTSKWISRIAAISGAAVPNCHFLSPSFASTLAAASSHTLRRSSEGLPAAKLSDAFTSDDLALPTPPTSHDTSAAHQARLLELAFAHLPGQQPARSLSTPLSRESELRKKGGTELASRTGRRAQVGSLAVQLLKMKQKRDEGSGDRGRSVQSRTGLDHAEGDGLSRTERIVLEPNLLSSLLIGKVAPLDVASAASSGLYNINTLDWDEQVLSLVTSRGGVDRLRTLLGPVQLDGGASLGPVGAHLVNNFGFSSECIVVPFTTQTAASSLAHPLSSDPSTPSGPSAIVCLSVEDADSITIPTTEFVPGVDWAVIPGPVRDFTDQAAYVHDQPNYLITITNEGAATGRSLVRDMNADADWNTYSQLCAIVPPGGSPGLDDKCYSFFSPHAPAQGLSKFSGGARTPEFEDRKLNPRLIIEGQFLSLRLRLSRLAAALSPPTPTPASPSSGSLGFDPFTTSGLPRKVLVTGAGSANPALIVILSTILGCEVVGMPELVPAAEKGEAGGTTSSALGAAKKARWVWARVKGDVGDVSFEEYERSVDAKREGLVQVDAADARAQLVGLSDSLAGLRVATGSVANGEVGGSGRLVSLAKVEGMEFEYYGSMLAEFERLSMGVSEGLI